MSLTLEQERLHNQAIVLCRECRKMEWPIIEILQRIDNSKLYRKFECSSLFVYAVKHLELDESVAYAMITAARKAKEIPRLAQSLKENEISVAKASRVLSTLTKDNAEQLISFAESHTANEINQEVERFRGQLGLPAKMHSLKVSNDTIAKLKRVRSLQKNGGDLEQALNAALDEYLDRHDPVKKAKRITVSKKPAAEPTSKLCTYRVEKRQPLKAEQKHAVFARDEGRCTHRDHSGNRCTNDRFLHIHHIRPVSQGGSNEPENLTTLCSFHHDLAHQLALPIEGQVTWLRDRRVAYGYPPNTSLRINYPKVAINKSMRGSPTNTAVVNKYELFVSF